jgi:hypothetical protein
LATVSRFRSWSGYLLPAFSINPGNRMMSQKATSSSAFVTE